MCKEQWIEPKYCITKPTKVLKIDKNEEEKGGGRNNNWGLEGRGGGRGRAPRTRLETRKIYYSAHSSCCAEMAAKNVLSPRSLLYWNSSVLLNKFM
jgi:hypothetical protein